MADRTLPPQTAAWIGYTVLGVAVAVGVVWGMRSISRAISDIVESFPDGEGDDR